MKIPVVLLAFLFIDSAYAVEIRCPDSISTHQTISDKIQGDWQTLADVFPNSQNLDNITIFDGHPSQQASLVPENEHSSGDPYWTFFKNSPGKIWIACSYTMTTMRLIRQLPQKFTKCVLKIKTKPTRDVGALICQ